MLEFLLSRLKEKTTWMGLFAVLAAAGMAVAPEMQEAIFQLALAVIGLIAIFTKEKE